MKYITNSLKEYVSDITLTLTEKCDTFLIRLFTKKEIKDILNSCKVFLTSKNELIIAGKHIIIRGVYFKDATTLKTLYFKNTLIECKNGVDIIWFSIKKQNVTPYGFGDLKIPNVKEFYESYFNAPTLTETLSKYSDNVVLGEKSDYEFWIPPCKNEKLLEIQSKGRVEKIRDTFEKIRLQSDYYPSGSDIFFFYDKDISNEIEKNGKLNIENEKDKENT